jgi:hypothetical protein
VVGIEAMTGCPICGKSFVKPEACAGHMAESIGSLTGAGPFFMGDESVFHG